MRAIVQERYGSPEEVLRVADVEKPAPQAGAVLVRVRASSVNAGDWRRVRASPFLVRLMEGIRRPRTSLLGGDAAGVVEAVGAGVTDLRKGDQVFGVRTGAFAEYVSGQSFVVKPASLTFEEAAAVPIAGITALQAVRDKGGIGRGQRVLVNGAGGGVGTFAVQIAGALGAEVTAVTSTAHVDLLRSLGAHHVVDYARQDVTRGTERYDVIVDVGGTPSIGALRRALAPGGRIVRVGAGKGLGPLVGLVSALVRSRVLRQPVVSFIAKVDKDDLRTLRELIDAGQVRPVIDRTFPLEQAAEALRYVETERARGKVVITVSSNGADALD